MSKLLRTIEGKEFAMRVTVTGENKKENEETSIIKGEADPLLCWCSPVFSEILPCPVVKLILQAVDQIKVGTYLSKIQ